MRPQAGSLASEGGATHIQHVTDISEHQGSWVLDHLALPDHPVHAVHLGWALGGRRDATFQCLRSVPDASVPCSVAGSIELSPVMQQWVYDTAADVWWSCCARRKLRWTFDLRGIGELYASYEEASFWPFLSAPTQGIRVAFVRAQHSSYAWSGADLDRLRAYGHAVHFLPNAGARAQAPLLPRASSDAPAAPCPLCHRIPQCPLLVPCPAKQLPTS